MLQRAGKAQVAAGEEGGGAALLGPRQHQQGRPRCAPSTPQNRASSSSSIGGGASCSRAEERTSSRAFLHLLTPRGTQEAAARPLVEQGLPAARCTAAATSIAALGGEERLAAPAAAVPDATNDARCRKDSVRRNALGMHAILMVPRMPCAKPASAQANVLCQTRERSKTLNGIVLLHLKARVPHRWCCFSRDLISGGGGAGASCAGRQGIHGGFGRPLSFPT